MIKLQHPKKEKYDLGKGCIYFVTDGKDDNYQVYRCLEDDEINDYEEIVNCQGEKCVFVHNFPSYELAEAAIISYWHAQDVIVLDLHETGFYEVQNGMKCEPMRLKGLYMLCNSDYNAFRKGEKYLINDNCNNIVDYLINDNCNNIVDYLNEKKLAAIEPNLGYFDYASEEYACYESVPVEKFADGTFTIIEKKGD